MQIHTLIPIEEHDALNQIIENWRVSHTVFSANSFSSEQVLAILEFALNLNGTTLYEEALNTDVTVE